METLLDIALEKRQAAADHLEVLLARPLATENEIYMARLNLDYWKKSVQYQTSKQGK